MLIDTRTKILDEIEVFLEGTGTSADALGKALKAFGIEAEDAGAQTDFLFRLTQKFGGSLGKITRATSEYGTVLKNAGFTMAQSADLFARLEASGISVSRVMPGLNAAFRRFAAAGLEPKAALEAVIVAMKNAESETKALTIATDAFGAEGAQRMTTAVRGGIIPALDELGQGLLEAQGAIEDTTKASETFTDKIGIAFNKLSVAFGGVGGGFLDSLNTGLDAVNVALDAMIPSIQAVSGALGKFIDAGGTGARIGEDLRKAFDEWRGVVDETTTAVEENTAAVDDAGTEYTTLAEDTKKLGLSYDDVLLALKNTGKAVKSFADKVRESLQSFRDQAAASRVAAVAQQEYAVALANSGKAIKDSEPARFALEASLERIAKQQRDLVTAESAATAAIGNQTEAWKNTTAAVLDLVTVLPEVPKSLNQLQPGIALLDRLEAGIRASAEQTEVFALAQAELNRRFQESQGDLASLEALQRALNRAQEDGSKTTQNLNKDMQAVSTILDDLFKSLADFILGMQSFADTLKSIGQAIVRTIINEVFKEMKKNILENDNALKGLIKTFKDFLGLGKETTKKAGDAAGDVVTGNRNKKPSPGGGVTTGGPLDIITSVGSLISQIIANFQLARLEGSLNKIEENTRQTARALIGDSLPRKLGKLVTNASGAQGLGAVQTPSGRKGFVVESFGNFVDPLGIIDKVTGKSDAERAAEAAQPFATAGIGITGQLFALQDFASEQLAQLEFQTKSLDTVKAELGILKDQGSRAEPIFTAIRDSLSGIKGGSFGAAVSIALLGEINETLRTGGEIFNEVRNTVSGLAKQFRFDRDIVQVTRDQQLRRLEDILKEIKMLVFNSGQPQQISINEFGQATFRNQLGPEGVLP